MSKFKVGDTVRILSDAKYNGIAVVLAYGVASAVGYIGVVNEIQRGLVFVTSLPPECLVGCNNQSWAYSDDELELLEREDDGEDLSSNIMLPHIESASDVYFVANKRRSTIYSYSTSRAAAARISRGIEEAFVTDATTAYHINGRVYCTGVHCIEPTPDDLTVDAMMQAVKEAEARYVQVLKKAQALGFSDDEIAILRGITADALFCRIA